MSAGSNAADLAERKLIAAHQALLHTHGLQFTFARAPTPKPPPEWLMALLRGLLAAAPVLKYVFWGGVALGLAWIVWLAVRDLALPGRTSKTAAPPAVDWRPDRAAALSLLEEADRLAASGRFEDAIHLLLFRSIDDLLARRPGAAPAALTTREIAERAPMPDAARSAFARIAEAVERTFFGGRPADGEDFLRCRGDYEAFAFNEAWR